MNGMPSENIDELDRRLTAIEEWRASIQVEPVAVEPEQTEPAPVQVFVDRAEEDEDASG